ncbi:unnamed protein product [Caenorhabditis bovis]|uniref:AN1-type domain-containing protein n=1 Tax=Caenorhabditis bovis TaxID=2654633 RepID=A0A8S1EM03_9PELO|nr:unnamed protein product [Caenorhabditis bovis]
MAEFPHFGEHCGVEICNQLDFLPIKCDMCSGFFCLTHYVYEAHNCAHAYKRNVQVPVCPLCNQPVPTPKNVNADFQINTHIENNCDIVKEAKIYTNRCSVKGCKKKELIPVVCPDCKLNYCLRHRHEKDHNCEELKANLKKNEAGIFRNPFSLFKSQVDNCSAQARKSAANDEQLARALQQEEYESAQPGGQQRSSRNQGCSVS